MTIEKMYTSSVRRELGRHAVWEPGNPLALGDFGEFSNGVFSKRGSINEFATTFQLEEGTRGFYEFTSEGTTAVQIDADGSARAGGGSVPQAGNAIAALEFSFGSSGGLVIRAAKSHVQSMSNIFEVALNLRKSPGWNFNWVVVSSIRFAAPATILMGLSKGTKLRVEGSAAVVHEFAAGKAVANAGMSISGADGYKWIGFSGPILMDLIRLRRFWRGELRAASPIDGADEAPFQYVATEDES
ncbi:hypothetical protein [Rhizobacter sp. P5_C2]